MSDKNFQKRICNFCGLTVYEVDCMFSSGISESHICSECVRICYEVLSYEPESMQEDEKESDC
ncbi:MAG: ClpX C4-type zinc finger protein [Oscillospiraceae bacterium]|nr:ClpX C4-type zinc finger protein [Oscillospiraceae bacterium]